MIEIKGPEGIVQFPDGTPDEVIERAMQETYGGGTGTGEQSAMGYLKAAGSGLAQGVIGIPQMAAEAGDWLGRKANTIVDPYLGYTPEETAARNAPVTQGPLAALRGASAAVNYEPQNVGEEYTKTVGQFLPSAALGPGGIGGKLMASVAGGLGSETAGQVARKVAPEYEPYARVAGGVAGAFVPAAVRGLVTPNPITAERSASINVLDDAGIPTTAGQRTGKQSLRVKETEWGGNAAAAASKATREKLTEAVLGKVGIRGKYATQEVINAKYVDMGNTFNRLASSHGLPASKRMMKEVTDVATDYAGLVGSASRANKVKDMAIDIVQFAQTGMSGKQYQVLMSKLESLAKKADAPTAMALRDLRNVVDSTMERYLAHIGSKDLGAWRAVRRDYRNMFVVESAAVKGSSITPQALKQATIAEQSKRSYSRGRGDFQRLSAAASEIIPDTLGNSGTGARIAARLAPAAITAGATGLGGMLAGAEGAMATMGGLAAGGAAAYTVPWAMGRALMSKPVQSYLGNRLLPEIANLTAKQRAAIALQGGLTGYNGPKGQ